MMNTNELVSIIIPIHNAEKTLEKTLESVGKQTWKNIEIIMVDDGSTDDSFSIAKKFESQNVKLFSQDNKGASAARNLGLSVASGSYIQYLDADDLLSDEKIEIQMNALRDNPQQIATCQTIFFKNGENHITKDPESQQKSFLFSTQNTADFLMNLYGEGGSAGMISIHSWLVPKHIIDKAGKWNEQITVDDDGEYFCRVVLGAKAIIYTPEAYCYYRKYSDGKNLSNRNTLEAMQSVFLAMKLKKKYLADRISSDRINRLFDTLYFQLAVLCYPKHKQLTSLIIKEINDLGAPKPPLKIGSRLANFIADNISWKLIRKIQDSKSTIKKWLR